MTVPEPDAAVGAAVCAALRAQVNRLGLSIGEEPVWAEARFSTQTDPFSREVSLLAVWSGQARYGTASFFPDGRVFAEYQVLLPLPGSAERYVESVQVWGRAEQLRGEAVIVEYPS